MGEPLFTLCLIVLNLGVSAYAFQNRDFFARYLFQVHAINIQKQYERLLTSAFLHGNWMHLIFNMISLYSFGKFLEYFQGSMIFLVTYLASLAGGGLLSLFMHRNDPYYSAVGASGAVSGVIFATVFIDPDLVRIFGIIPGWLFAILFVLYSLYGMKTRSGNIGHDAHLGGAIVGMIFGVVINPEILQTHWWMILLMVLPMAFYFYLYLTPGKMVAFEIWFQKVKSGQTGGGGGARKTKMKVVYERGDSPAKMRQRELDELLDKVARKGLGSLSEQEKSRLYYLSDQINKRNGPGGRSASDSDQPGQA
ncbi:MAG: rhomboid family intramembrane serine protease [Bacteroidia bacterium]|nr:rhomboid family intramembrane serine protease [Bacteroidia bacterium]